MVYSEIILFIAVGSFRGEKFSVPAKIVLIFALIRRRKEVSVTMV